MGFVKVDRDYGRPAGHRSLPRPWPGWSLGHPRKRRRHEDCGGGRFHREPDLHGLPTLSTQNSQHTGTMHDAVAMDGWVATFDCLTPLWFNSLA